MTVGALDGVSVVDLTKGIAGPLAAMLLGDLGADVLRIEPRAGDRRAAGPGYLCWNRNKTVAVADLDRPADLGELRRVLGRADVVLVDGARTALESLQLDGVSVHAAYPQVVHVWLPAYGESGRWSALPADPVLLAGVSGVADLHNATEDRPVVPVAPVIQYEQGVLAATMAVAGLVRRARTGVGGVVHVSGLHGVAAMLASSLTDGPGARPLTKAAASPLPQYRHYRCSDGRWLYLGALTAPFFLTALGVLDLVEVMLLPGVDGEYANLLQPDVAGPVIEAVAARFAERPRDEWLDALAAAGVPCAPVASRDDWLASETVAANDLLVTLEYPGLGPVTLPAPPLRFSATACEVRSLPPDPLAREPLARCWRDDATTAAASTGSAPDAVTPRPDPLTPDPLTPAPLPLAGVRVLDLSTFVAGTFAPAILASLGADVVKVESLAGDPYRVFGLSFAAFNQRKRGLAIDLKHPDGFAALTRLLAGADVVVDNLRPGPRARLGLTTAALRRVRPDLVCCSVTGFGDVGPLAETPGFDPLIQARSGLMAAQGGADDPVFSVMLVHDILAGSLGALGILAALLHRGRTGNGQDVHLSLAGASMVAQSAEFVRYDGRPPAPVGGRDWPGPSRGHRLYPCRDGWIAVAATVGARDGWDRVLAEIDGAEVSATPPCLRDDGVPEALARLGVDEAVDLFTCSGVPAARVLRRGEIVTDPWFAENAMFHRVEDPAFGECTLVRGWSHWPGTQQVRATSSPQLGQHTRELLKAAGMRNHEIDRLQSAGALRADVDLAARS